METIKATIQSVQNVLVGEKKDTNDNINDNAHQQHHEHSSSDKPTPSLPANDQTSRPAEAGVNRTASSDSASSKVGLTDDLEKTLSGPKDPALQGEEHPKMTGQGAPGSHSALFGLTPDGKKA